MTSEEVELDPQLQQELLDLDGRLDTTDFFRLLGVSVGATPEEIKKAYWNASRKYHPDRFFGKRLGSFQGRLDRIFRRFTEAQETLINPGRRDEYLKANPRLAAQVRAAAADVAKAAATAKASSPPPRAPVEPLQPADTLRGAERRARLARHPYLVRSHRLNEILARAKAHIASSDFGKAHNDLELAIQIEPKNLEVQKLLTDVRKRHGQARSELAFKRAESSETTGNLEDAFRYYNEALGADPDSPKALARMAALMKRMGKDLNAARALAQKAVMLEPKNPEYKILWATLLEALGMHTLAKRQREEASALDPQHADSAKAEKKRR